MNINLKYDAQAAIDASVERNEIVHILSSEEDAATLRAECVDSTEAGQDDQGREITEFWGKSGADDWRVHTHDPLEEE